jgi:N utilization substance protein A
MKLDTMMEAIEVLARERGVAIDTILDAFANALVAAYKRSPGAAEEARVTIDPDSGEVIVYAQELDEEGNVVKEWEDTPEGEAFGRIAAQSFKQVMQHKLREAKREHVFEMYEGREGDLVTGLVQQVDYRSVILDLGDAEAILPGSERIPFERLERGNRVKALILEVRNEAKGAQIVVSRSHPDLVRRLLELEVPELTDGTVEIVNIAREPGHRTKIAVISHDPNVDPKGACVGARGSRVRQVVNELRGEKVDVVQWRDDIGQFIAEALGPAKVKEVHIDEETKTADVVVSEHQLSLAIGKEGQNARLAARLSGYKVDIRSDNQGVPEEVVTEEVVTEEKVIEDVASEETAATDAVGDETSLAEEASDVVTEEVTEVVTVETETVEAEPDEDAADAEGTVAPSVDLGESASDDEDAVVTADEDEESE